MDVLLNKRKAYAWTAEAHCYFRGYLQLQDGTVLRGAEAIRYVKAAADYQAFSELLKTAGGSFAVIVCNPEEVWAAVDPARSMPLYFAEDLSVLSDCAETIRKKLKIPKDQADPVRLAELYNTMYVAFENTAFREIKQIELGHSARFTKDAFETVPYFIHAGTPDRAATEDELLQKLRSTAERMVQRLLKAVDGRQIVLSLSGGYDSRFVACSLKENGVENVVCYTYGKRGSFEIETSRRVAEALGYQWFCAEYTDQDVRTILTGSLEKEFFRYCVGHDYIVYLQNYLAVKKLMETDLVAPDAVFVTGLCHDMPTGEYIPDEQTAAAYGFTNQGAAQYIVDKKCIWFQPCEAQNRFFCQEVEQHLAALSVTVTDYASFVSALDCITTGGNHSRCFLHMNDVHEFFGHEWLTPCWDPGLLRFWYSVPPELRRGQYLYETYVVDHLAAKYGVGQKKTMIMPSSHEKLDRLKRVVGGVVVQATFPLGIPVKRRGDLQNFAALEVDLYQAIVQKDAIIRERTTFYLMLTIYVMELRYGTRWFEHLKKTKLIDFSAVH